MNGYPDRDREGKKTLFSSGISYSLRTVHRLLFVVYITWYYETYATNCNIPSDSTRNFEVRMENLKVPNISTYYACQQFEIPHDEEYHATVFEPLVESKKLIHHMLLFGCEQNQPSLDAHQCGDVDGACTSWLAQYTIGLDGKICTYNNTGIRFGRNSFRYFLLQVHYNNGKLQSGLQGISGKMEVFQAGKKKVTVAQDTGYLYDQSPIHVMKTPVEIYPGSIFIEYPWDQTKYTMTSMRELQEVTASCSESDCSAQCVTKTKEIKASLRPKSAFVGYTETTTILKARKEGISNQTRLQYQQQNTNTPDVEKQRLREPSNRQKRDIRYDTQYDNP
ncbi:hypothetical protein FSP39_007891 [Pinctada imbricata]|uniref:Copper type II ascorbate-dependent monooxygenase N-terminal domain-containing protein n=1 Tax=Pinctada imbricata TaxID=66713 RepID=A0AA88YH04_PINIB|nr:hypothetical protein FSP39_007891 [Pinctada imbricata]